MTEVFSIVGSKLKQIEDIINNVWRKEDHILFFFYLDLLETEKVLEIFGALQPWWFYVSQIKTQLWTGQLNYQKMIKINGEVCLNG